MRKVETPAGTLYVEDINGREEAERIKIYDSNQKYLSFVYYRNLKGYNQVIKDLVNLQTPEEILDYVGLEYLKVYSPDRLVEMYLEMIRLEHFDPETVRIINRKILQGNVTDYFILTHDWTNVIGDKYILVQDC